MSNMLEDDLRFSEHSLSRSQNAGVHTGQIPHPPTGEPVLNSRTSESVVNNKAPILLDCTLRDGGYYNNWDFPDELIVKYVKAIEAAGVDIVELGFRFIENKEFMGACAFTTDSFIRDLQLPKSITIGVMLNGSDLFIRESIESALMELFPENAETCPVQLVRIACHAKELIQTLPASQWLVDRGYRVGFNIMQIADKSREEILNLAEEAKKWPIEVLYFADSLGGMTPLQAADIVHWLSTSWGGAVGIHTHDNLGLALQNSLSAIKAGATWVDSTVTGMGRGPGNALTEELALEISALRPSRRVEFSALLDLVENDFAPIKAQCGWGKNPYYYLSGKYGIHPSYIQEMLADKRFDHNDRLSVIEALKQNGGKSFSLKTMHNLRITPHKEWCSGDWKPIRHLEGRDVLILGNGPSVSRHRKAIERFKQQKNPIVFGLNISSSIDESLIDYRLACHPLRLLADAKMHSTQIQPLITPVAELPSSFMKSLAGKQILNFGMRVTPGVFEFDDSNCVTPGLLVTAYALAVASSGGARTIYLAGFDGFEHGDPRTHEMQQLLELCANNPDTPELVSITNTTYDFITVKSVYGIAK